MKRQLASRSRWWLLAGTVCTLVLAYLIGWAAYAYVRLPDVVRYEVVAPGSVVEARTASVALISLTATTELTDQEYGGEPTLSPAGATWVVARMRVTTHPADGLAICDLWLIGPDRRRWEAQSTVSGRSLPSYCGDDSIEAGRPAELEVIFAVPDRYLDQIVGVGVFNSTTNARTKVLRPGS